ncbi:unnamed protein product, partial [Tilletia caries]
ARYVKPEWLRKLFWIYTIVEIPFSICLLRKLMLQCCAVGTEHFDQDVLKSADEADAAAGTSPDITKPASEPASGTASPSVRRSPPLFPPGSRFDQTTEEQAAKMRLGFSNWFFCSSIEDVKRGNVFEWSA